MVDKEVVLIVMFLYPLNSITAQATACVHHKYIYEYGEKPSEYTTPQNLYFIYIQLPVSPILMCPFMLKHF